MPKFTWEWKLTPQIVVSIANLTVLALGLLWAGFQLRSDVNISQQTVIELRAVVKTLTEAQILMSERLMRVQTQVDMMMPALQRIEANQHKLKP